MSKEGIDQSRSRSKPSRVLFSLPAAAQEYLVAVGGLLDAEYRQMMPGV